MSKSKGMPGMRGIEHFAMTVPDLDAACKFFEEVMGCEVLFSAGSFSRETGVRMDEQINVHPQARCVEYRYVRCGNGLNLKLFQYKSPDQKMEGPTAGLTWIYFLAPWA